MRAVIMFDFDGVVADSYDVFFETFTAVCAEMGFDRLNSREAFLKLFEGNLLQQLLKAGFPLWRLKALVKRFEPRIAEANLKIRPFPGMPELLCELAAAHPVYIITSNVSRAVEAFCARFDIAGIRDVIGAEKEASKVKKIRAVRNLHRGHAPYYVGDTKGDMIEGKAARATTVAAAWGWHPLATLHAGAPDIIVHDPEELRRIFL